MPVFSFELMLRRRLVRVEKLISKISAAEKRIINFRLLTITLILVSLGLYYFGKMEYLWIVAVIGFAAFMFLIQKHDHIKLRRFLAIHDQTFIERSLEQLQFRSPVQLRDEPSYETSYPAHATDLNLVGKNSLSQLLDRTTSATARKKLNDNLITGVPDISRRRETLQFLAAHFGAGSKMLGLSHFYNLKDVKAASLRLWLDNPMAFNTTWRWVGVIGIGWFIVGSALEIYPLAGFIALFFISTLMSRRLRPLYMMLIGLDKVLRGLGAVSAVFQKISIGSDKQKPDEINSFLKPSLIAESQKFVSFANVATNELMYGLLNAAFWFDAWVVHGVQNFKANHGEEFERLLDEAAELESLISQSHALHLPQMTFANSSTDKVMIEAAALAHPLIAQAVPNDVKIEIGETLIITGSNMSGKTTFLRTIGMAMQMHRAGLPVRAGSVRIKELPLMTSIRITDDLAEGESFFYAEVKTLKAMIDTAKQTPLVCIIDEMLKGTNTRERLIASRSVLKILRECGATALVRE
jgi:ABC-type multidrug transport system fused ATPase/permease subunit